MARLLSLLEMERLARPGATDRACIRAVAAGLIDELGVGEPPIDVAMVASALDIQRVVPDHQMAAAGCLIPRSQGTEVRVRASDPTPRQRFTVCHECGHTFFPGYALQSHYRCAPQSLTSEGRDLETLCDVAASELLLPRRLLRPAVLDAGLSLGAIEDLADVFAASLVATGAAVVGLQQRPTALLTFRMRQKPRETGTEAEPKLRLDSFVTVGDWPFLRRFKSAEPHDVFDRASKGEIVSERGVTIKGICPPVHCDVESRLYPYVVQGSREHRVLALLTRSGTT